MKQLFLLPIIFSFLCSNAQDIAILKYSGGGDWYANPTALPNLIAFTNKTIGTSIAKNSKTVDIGSEAIFSFPMVFMTGHGSVSFSETETQNLKKYLISGGFLHISDNYGMDTYVKREFKKVFPKLKFIEIPSRHSIYNQTYKFPDGIPKIHEHDKKPAQGYGLFYNGRLIVFYDYESDLSDGWEDEIIHNNPKNVREKALKMGANIIEYAFKN
jgi:hypothetical protein